MHNFSTKDVEADDFDLSKLSMSKEDMSEILSELKDISEQIKAENRNNGELTVHPRFIVAYPCDIFRRSKLITESVLLSCAFNSEYFNQIFSLDTSLYRILMDSLFENKKVVKKILFYKHSPLSIKEHILYKYFDMEYLDSFIEIDFLHSLSTKSQQNFIEIISVKQAFEFTKSKIPKIRLLAYKKIGPIDHIDMMIKDSFAIVREFALKLLPREDPRLNLLIDDGSSNVFISLIYKITPEKLPILMGSKHLKSKHVRNIFDNKINKFKEVNNA